MLRGATRVFQRYLIPRWFATIYYLVRCRAFVSPLAKVQVSRHVSFGPGTVVKPYCVITTHTGKISFGANCRISSFDHISTGDADVVFGDLVRLAASVTIVGEMKQFRRRDVPTLYQELGENQGLLVGDDVLFGANSVLLPGCKVGRGAVVGAGSVVRSDIAEYAIVAGVPAEPVGARQ